MTAKKVKEAEVTKYVLSENELAKYREMKPPTNSKDTQITAPRKYTNDNSLRNKGV